MYKNELDKLIEKNSLPNVLCLYGESDFLINYYSEKIAKLKSSKDERTIIYYEDYDFNFLKSLLSQNSLFGEMTFVILKLEKKLPKLEIKKLIELAQKSDSNYLLVEFYSKEQKSNDVKDFISNFEHNVRFFNPYPNEAMEILKNRALELKVDLNIDSLQHLFMILNGDLTLAYHELSKLSILSEVGIKEIDMLVYNSSTLNAQDIIKRVINRENYKEELLKLLHEDDEGVQFITSIQNYFSTLFLFYSFININGFADSLNIMGYKMPKNIETQFAQMATKLNLKSYEKIFILLQDSELKLKTVPKIDKKATIISLLIKLQTFFR